MSVYFRYIPGIDLHTFAVYVDLLDVGLYTRTTELRATDGAVGSAYVLAVRLGLGCRVLSVYVRSGNMLHTGELRAEDDAVGSALVLAVVIERFHDQVWYPRTRAQYQAWRSTAAVV
eukprot:220485-Rhodomonas_salina.1